MTDEELLRETQAKFPNNRLALVKVTAGTIIFRNATSVEYRLFEKGVLDEKMGMLASQAYSNLMLTTVVHPDRALLVQWFDSWAGLPMNKKLINAINELNGVTEAEDLK
jgi:hypothetical protein